MRLLSRLKDKKLLLILLLLSASIFLFFCFYEKESAPAAADGFDLEGYKSEMTREARELCISATGDPALHVVLYFEGKESYVYAKEESPSGGKGYVTSGGEGLLLEVKMPRVSGVSVVCQNGSDPAIQRELSLHLSSLFGIGLERIHVSGKPG